MREQEKKRQRIYDIIIIKTKPNFLCLPSKEKTFTGGARGVVVIVVGK